jgi:hypothetical protein
MAVADHEADPGAFILIGVNDGWCVLKGGNPTASVARPARSCPGYGDDREHKSRRENADAMAGVGETLRAVVRGDRPRNYWFKYSGASDASGDSGVWDVWDVPDV